jgi:hypothetical protein
MRSISKYVERESEVWTGCRRECQTCYAEGRRWRQTEAYGNTANVNWQRGLQAPFSSCPLGGFCLASHCWSHLPAGRRIGSPAWHLCGGGGGECAWTRLAGQVWGITNRGCGAFRTEKAGSRLLRWVGERLNGERAVVRERKERVTTKRYQQLVVDLELAMTGPIMATHLSAKRDLLIALLVLGEMTDAIATYGTRHSKTVPSSGTATATHCIGPRQDDQERKIMPSCPLVFMPACPWG